MLGALHEQYADDEAGRRVTQQVVDAADNGDLKHEVDNQISDQTPSPGWARGVLVSLHTFSCT